jgi:hypothetical protein
MDKHWEELVALAEELDAACKAKTNVDPEKVRRLARGVIALPQEPTRSPSGPTRSDSSRLH